MKNKNKMSLTGVLGSSDPFFGPDAPPDNPENITEILDNILKENPELERQMSITNFNKQSIFFNLAEISAEIHRNYDLKDELSTILSNIFKKYKNDKDVLELKKFLVKAKDPKLYYQQDKDWLIN